MKGEGGAVLSVIQWLREMCEICGRSLSATSFLGFLSARQALSTRGLAVTTRLQSGPATGGGPFAGCPDSVVVKYF